MYCDGNSTYYRRLRPVLNAKDHLLLLVAVQVNEDTQSHIIAIS